MGKLDQTVGEAERMYREMRALAQSGDIEAKRQIVKLRSRYAMLMLEILQVMKADERLQNDPELKGEFERRFFAMRSQLAEHQVKWRLQTIEDDTQEYIKSAEGLNGVQDDFYRWVGSNFSLH
jgi:hypothetical protein